MADPQPGFASFSEELEELQRRWSEEDARDKISNRVTMRLSELYRQTDPARRDMFDRLLAVWVQSQEPVKWFDGAALIREFRVHSALPFAREALSYWKAQVAQHPDMKRGGDYGDRRSDALSRVEMLEAVVRELAVGPNRPTEG